MIASKLDAKEKMQVMLSPQLVLQLRNQVLSVLDGASQPGTAHFLSHGDVLLETKICSRQKSVQAMWLSNRV